MRCFMDEAVVYICLAQFQVKCILNVNIPFLSSPWTAHTHLLHVLAAIVYHCVRLVPPAPALQYFLLTSLQLQPPATSQVIVFFSHTTPTPACRTRWLSVRLHLRFTHMAFACSYVVILIQECNSNHAQLWIVPGHMHCRKQELQALY